KLAPLFSPLQKFVRTGVTENIKPKAANRGLALRRRDAAIELSKLAEKQEEKRKRHSANPVEMGKN
ncbi:hypothetical protein, partial [Victivallis vadensis]|uniref:hypothetical protein n=1 Tax=Victivallis vadensis TaxID=172901 RepID=UPI0026DD844A